MTTSLEYETSTMAIATQMLLDRIADLNLSRPMSHKSFDELYWIAAKIRDDAAVLHEKAVAAEEDRCDALRADREAGA